MRLLRRCFLLFAFPALALAQTAPPTPHTISIGEVDSLWSPTLKEYRSYIVYTPPGYARSVYQPRAYPVLYLLDGDAHFHSVTGLLQALSTGVNNTFVLPEMIVVAIPNTDRTRDLTPTNSTASPDGKTVAGFKTSGGMPNFLSFIKTELIPHIDSTYRTEPYRLLIGHSLGGIAVINALYTMPETFNSYVAIDPSLWWDHQLLLKKANEYFSKPAPAGRTLFVGQANTLGANDTVPNVHFKSIGQFNSVLQTSNKSSIRYGYKYYADDDHGSVPLIAEYDALRFIFHEYKLDRQKAVAMPTSIGEHYAKLSVEMGYRVLPPEQVIDRLTQDDPTKAIALSRINTENYPMSPHAFLALGNALLAHGDSAEARAAFERSLALDPANQRVRDLLNALRTRR